MGPPPHHCSRRLSSAPPRSPGGSTGSGWKGRKAAKGSSVRILFSDESGGRKFVDYGASSSLPSVRVGMSTRLQSHLEPISRKTHHSFLVSGTPGQDHHSGSGGSDSPSFLSLPPHTIFPVFRMYRPAINMPMTTRIIATNAHSIPWLTAASLIPIDNRAWPGGRCDG
jgi:hypothetical protein